MDPTIMQLLQMYQASHQGQMYPGIRQSGGMFGGQQQPQPQTGQGQQTGQPDQQDHHGGFSPWMMLSPLIGAFASGHPNIGLGMISPGLGIARALGAFK